MSFMEVSASNGTAFAPSYGGDAEIGMPDKRDCLLERHFAVQYDLRRRQTGGMDTDANDMKRDLGEGGGGDLEESGIEQHRPDGYGVDPAGVGRGIGVVRDAFIDAVRDMNNRASGRHFGF